MSHPSNGLDDTVHQRTRLGILTVLAEARRADFTYLKATLDLTDGNLSRHLQVLADAGHVEIDKTFDNRKSRTWISLTRQGRQALSDELDHLRALIDRVG